MTQPTHRWVVVHAHPNTELKAEFHLRRQGYTVYLPRYLRKVRHARKTEMVTRPLFPRYLFVHLNDDDAWRPLCSTVGVSGLVCNGDAPAAVPAGIIEGLRAREDEHGLIKVNEGHSFRIGEPVRVELGSFSGLEGIFESDDGQERVTILLNLLGGRVKANLPLEAIRATA